MCLNWAPAVGSGPHHAMAAEASRAGPMGGRVSGSERRLLQNTAGHHATLPKHSSRRGGAGVDRLHYLLEALTGNEKAPASCTPPKLTRREESVVRLVMQGMVNRKIAEPLRLSEYTVKSHLFRIFDKLGVSNRVELVLYAVAKLKLEESAACLTLPARLNQSSVLSKQSRPLPAYPLLPVLVRKFALCLVSTATR